MLCLASGSPQRLALLSRLGLQPRVLPVAVDERLLEGERAEAAVARLAAVKGEAARARLAAEARWGEPEQFGVETPALVLAADTLVVSEWGSVLGKPADAQAARAMLFELSGAWHTVWTGVWLRPALAAEAPVWQVVVPTRVLFRTLEAQEIDAYVASGEPIGKAGAYALQGAGDALVSRIEGSVSAVLGLPLAEVVQGLARFGLRVSFSRTQTEGMPA